jgi:hypothetical protein
MSSTEMNSTFILSFALTVVGVNASEMSRKRAAEIGG